MDKSIVNGQDVRPTVRMAKLGLNARAFAERTEFELGPWLARPQCVKCLLPVKIIGS